MADDWARTDCKRDYSVTHCISDKMKALKLFLQLCLISGICVIIGFAGWIGYLLWWIVEGMR